MQLVAQSSFGRYHKAECYVPHFALVAKCLQLGLFQFLCSVDRLDMFEGVRAAWYEP